MGSPSASNNGSNDTQVSAYEKEITKQKKGTKKEINKGINVSTYGETKTGIKPADYNPEKDDTAAKMDLFINNPYTKKQGGPLMLRPLEPLFDAGAKKTRTFFSDKVLNSKKAKKNIGYTKEEFFKLSKTKQEEVYKGYLSNRSSNKTDAYGNPISQSDNGGAIASSGQVVQAPAVTAPTTAEVSQSAATDAAEDSLILRKRKAKARGRSPTIMTGVTGATGSLTLGKPSLLGS